MGHADRGSQRHAPSWEDTSDRVTIFACNELSAGGGCLVPWEFWLWGLQTCPLNAHCDRQLCPEGPEPPPNCPSRVPRSRARASNLPLAVRLEVPELPPNCPSAWGADIAYLSEDDIRSALA